MFSITPTPSRDPSTRMASTGYVSPPFYELGFDQLAFRISFSQTVTLSQITSQERLASYGRPLWHPYCNGLDLIQFAAKKLLGGTDYTKQPIIDVSQQLACLAQRIPIEFLSARYVAQVSEQEKEQIHSHMRVILNVEDNLETMVTTSPSEPILSEAAYFVMTTQPPSQFSPPQALQNILNGFAVHKGELGELIVALLFTMARDKAVGPADELGRPQLQGQRWCRVTDLLQSLFCSATIVESHGCNFRQSGTRPHAVPLSETFKNSKTYFTHFIKVLEHAVVDINFLMPLMVRGAAILCGNGQRGIDGIIPFLFEGNEIRLDNIGVIMFQVKNSAKYTNTPNPTVLLKMDPLYLGLTDPNIPVIRFVFALAATTPTLSSINHATTYNLKSLNQITAYDFWVSGLSSTVLHPVVDKQAAWESILQASHGWNKIYSGRGEESMMLRKSMNPGVATDKEYWQNWCERVPE
ncbi:hypothetical protein L210DRAFT_2278101 [Boletus edulis BED1]|uniref:Uncharacterized protein n=1 Tax=Boletus edulis BED1 TaxID=1328754 RepID=A0AAD4BT43_BOLED|nr:hypothetical protein L210DRAFT_2278101 [Boletus edulis BED1]